MFSVKPDPPEQFYSDVSDMPRPIAKLLWQRGAKNKDEARTFLYPQPSDLGNPFQLKGMKEVSERILRAVKNNETIALVSDYDADGATAAAGMTYLFRALGHYNTIVYIPNRIKTGVYGLTMEIVDDIYRQGATCMIITDCGMSGPDEQRAALKKGIDVMVIDHHKKTSELPAGVILVNPHQDGEMYPFHDFCAAGLVLKVFQACRGSVDSTMFQFAALGTIADKVPLVDENRVITRLGFEYLEASDNVGIRELGELCENNIISMSERLNACSELYRTNNTFELLVSDDAALARRFAHELNETYWKQYKLFLKVLEIAVKKADAFAERKILALEDESFTPEIRSPLAGRLSLVLRKPVIVYTVDGDYAHGAARSGGRVHLVELLKACGHLLVRFGGHPDAAGFSILNKDMAQFLECLQCHEDMVAPLQVTKNIELDASVGGSAKEIYTYLERMKPYGMANPAPFLLFDISAYTHPSSLSPSEGTNGGG